MAIISNKKRFCFIHINNTGGTTVTSLLNEVVDDLEIVGKTYSTMSEALIEMPKVTDYYKFTYVRNPYDWLVSLFSSIITDYNHSDWAVVNKLSFYEFIQWLGDVGFKRKLDGGLTIYKKQTDFVFSSGNILVNDVYFYEDLCNDIGLSNVNTIFLKLGFNMPSNVPVLNKTVRTPNWDNLFDHKTYLLVNELFSEDFKNFKYNKNEH